jgi:signal transduction histidine kinase
MPQELLPIINQFGIPGLVIVGMWFVLKQVDKRNTEKDVIIQQILREGQIRIESLVNMVMDLSREDAKNRAELKAAIDASIEAISRMQDFCKGQKFNG